MKPPFCKICQNNHSLRDPHIWTEEAGTIKKRIDYAKSVANKTKAVANSIGSVANKKYGRYKDIEKRKAYMREYMKRKRHGNPG